MNRIVTFVCIICISFLLFSENKTLPIPPVIHAENLKLEIKHGQIEFPFGISKSMGFNGNYLGPTIMLNNNDLFSIRIDNNLKEDTTVHWHGLHVPAEFDGGPHQVIKKGKSWKPEFYIRQNASTLWYHPHLFGKTAEHVYNGLAGMFYIDDEYSKSLKIPKDYGINDIPIIIQDRYIGKDGTFIYRPGMHDEVFGYLGNVVLINGEYEPVLNIDSGTYRFRILNGSNSSIYRVRFTNNKEFTVIASDGGFLPKTISVDEIILSPGERYEILIDFNKNEMLNLITDIYNGSSFKPLEIVSSNNTGTFFEHPKEFNTTTLQYDEENTKTRKFLMETRMMGRFTINGKTMSMKRIDFTLSKNTTEIWIVKNLGFGMMQVPHSFHVHDVQFKIISINDKEPDILYSGFKDTILVMPGDEYKIALSFKDYTGLYMYHCHFLEHEDNGMMGQFMVE